VRRDQRAQRDHALASRRVRHVVSEGAAPHARLWKRVQTAGERDRAFAGIVTAGHPWIIPSFRAVVTPGQRVISLFQGMAEPRIIKRYANRKLYDTQHSRYVTLDQISEMIRAGDEVKIIDNKSKEDLTSVTLAQIIFEEEKKQKSFLPLQAMRNIIQTGGDSIQQLVSEAQKRVTGAFQKKEGADGAAEAGDDGGGDGDGAPERKPHGPHVPHVPRTLREYREWINNTQRTIDEWQKRVDDRIRNVVEGISPFAGLQKDVRELGSRIAELEQKLELLADEEAAVNGEDP
jgi:polyhydroxyalkanoate synthesis repressor PhaR